MYLPQNGIPSGDQFPFSHTRLAGPSSSKPRSHEYAATAPLPRDSSENVTELCAGDPGKLHGCPDEMKQRNEKKKIKITKG